MQPEDLPLRAAAAANAEQRAAVAADGKLAATKLAEHFPAADQSDWPLPLWTANFWRALPPHIQRQVSGG